MRGYREVLARAPRSIDALMNLGTACATLGFASEAEQLLRRARLLAPNANELQRDAATAYIEIARWNDAEAATRQAIAVAPRDGLAHALMGHVCLENGRAEEARAALRKAVAFAPAFAPAWFTLHRALFDDRDVGPSIDPLRRAIELDPDHLHYRFALATALAAAADREGMEVAASAVAELGAPDGAFSGALDGLRYAVAHRDPKTRLFATTREGLVHGLERARTEGLVVELGVRHGASIRWIASRVKGPVHGFDSFEGLPEAWHVVARGAYSTQGELPRVPTHVKLHRGWFDATVPPFVAANPGPLRFANVDCDLYSSTKVAFDELGDRVGPGTVIAFDEYLENDRWREDEFKAWQELVQARGLRYRYLSFGHTTKQAIVRVD